MENRSSNVCKSGTTCSLFVVLRFFIAEIVLFFFLNLFCPQAFCETLEEGNYRLQKELLEKQKEISFLKKMLEEKELYIHLLEKRIK